MRSTSLFTPAAASITKQDEVGVLGAGPGGRDHRAVEAPLGLEDAGRVDQQDLRRPSIAMPISRARVVCAFGLTIATFWPTSALTSVDLPALGAPITATKPAFVFAFGHCSCDNRAAAAAVSASCLLVPSAVASPSFGTETRTVKFGAWCAPVREPPHRPAP